VADDASKATLNGFRSLKPIGSTGVWDSFSGYSEQLNQEVSVAVVSADALKEEALQKKLYDVVKAAANIKHPMLSRCLLASPMPDGRWSILSEPPAGKTLAQYLREHGPMTGDEAVQLCAQLCEAVDAAHQNGVLHGDIRPENIQLVGSPGAFRPKLSGFVLGLLNPTREKGYSAPELAQRKEPTALTDLYALGAVIWTCLTGSPPLDYDVEKLPALPEDEEHLLPVLKKALQRDFSRRYFTAAELGRALTKANGTLVPPPAKPLEKTTPLISSTSEATQALGTMLGPYELVKLLGEGSMGQVFLARHKALGRQVAIKVLRPEQYSRGDLIQRFFQEARTVNQINHEHIVEIFDFVQEPGPAGPSAVYCVMELLTGESLTAVVEKGPVALQRSLSIVRQLCDALSAAHKVGVVHRDVKPDNIFLIERAWQRDYVKVLDFGVAKLMHADPDAPLISTMDGAIIGTPMCMAPEQAAGQTVDWRADIYATGVILYLLLSGRLPFDAKNFAALAVQLITQPPPPLPNSTPAGEAVPDALKAVVLKCLAKDPKDRPQSMKELGDALAPFVAFVPGTGPGAPATAALATARALPALEEPSKKRSSAGVFVALGVAVVLAGAGGTLAYLRPWERPAVAATPDPQPTPPQPTPQPTPPQPTAVQPTPTPTPDPAPEVKQANPPPEVADPTPPHPTPPPEVKPPPPPKPVKLTPALLQEGASHVSKEVHACILRYAPSLPNPEGAVKIQVRIELSGATTDPKVLTEGISGPLEECLLKEARRLRFARNVGPPGKVIIPFTYKLSGGG
jgi:serine/threonine-protein kinase